MEQPVHQGAVFVARRWMHRETRWLVDHDQVLVFEEHIEIHGLRLQVRQRLRWRHPQLHFIPLAQRRFGLAGFAVHAHETGINELLNASAALLRPLTHQPAIQTHRQGLGISEGDQLTFSLPKGLGEGLLWQGGPGPPLTLGTHAAGSAGSSREMLPRADLRKSSISRCAIRAVSAEVCFSAAACIHNAGSAVSPLRAMP